MLNKIDVGKYPELKQKFHEYISKYPLVNAVINNIQSGYAYADKNNKNLFICTKSGFSLLLFENSEEIDILFTFLKETTEIPNYIHLYSPEKTFVKYLEGNWDKFKIRERCQFRYFKNSPTYNYKEILPQGFSIMKIQDLEFSKLDLFKLELDNRYWQSKDDFLENAIGACIVNNINEPVAICYSACVVDNIAEMDTLVLNEYRGMSFMRIVSEPFFNFTIEKGKIAHWDTFIANVPSFEMAQKFGLQEIQKYDLVSVLLR